MLKIVIPSVYNVKFPLSHKHTQIYIFMYTCFYIAAVNGHAFNAIIFKCFVFHTDICRIIEYISSNRVMLLLPTSCCTADSALPCPGCWPCGLASASCCYARPRSIRPSSNTMWPDLVALTSSLWVCKCAALVSVTPQPSEAACKMLPSLG